ncbi:hypothetical protein ACIBHX_23835 [Nonomuraea sp. NPDC050536]|uniref:hypothetical protein n=1 Tax=Nonomuraea sp. NPDC050536 TaxID=3364366 RepID=UPI0037C608FD
MKRRSTLGVLGWLAVAALTTVTSTWAISLLGQGLSRHVVTPMSQVQVSQALATATTAPQPSSPATAGAGRVFVTSGGTVVGGCDGDRATLHSWSPAQGYAADEVERGPGASASVEFESENGRIKVWITCGDGQPELHTDTTVVD